MPFNNIAHTHTHNTGMLKEKHGFAKFSTHYGIRIITLVTIFMFRIKRKFGRIIKRVDYLWGTIKVRRLCKILQKLETLQTHCAYSASLKFNCIPNLMISTIDVHGHRDFPLFSYIKEIL